MIPWLAPVARIGVRGRVVLPGSKSATARSLVLAALADGPSTLSGVLDSRDTSLLRAGLQTLGASFSEAGPDVLVVTPATEVTGGGRIDCGLAGTVLRFLPPIAALADEPTTFFGDTEAGARPIAPLLAALARLGARVPPPHRLPFMVSGQVGFAGGAVSLDASASSQFVSALLLAGARFADGVTVSHVGNPLPSQPHIEMTRLLLARRGVVSEHPEQWTWQVAPGPIRGLDEQIEPDLTNTATFLAAALVTGGTLSAAWPDPSVQPANELADVLAAFGAQLTYSGIGAQRSLSVHADGVSGARVDLHSISEFTPVAAALAAVADSPSLISGVAHIRGHESDRIAALAENLTNLGIAASQTSDGLSIVPRQRHGGRWSTHSDHRLAHAGALIGLVTPGVELDDVSCTTKTLPDFPHMWTRLVSQA